MGNLSRANIAFSDVECLDIRIEKVFVNPSEDLSWKQKNEEDESLWSARIIQDEDVPLGYVVVEGEEDRELRSIGRLVSSTPNRKMTRLSLRYGMERAEICNQMNFGVRWMADALSFMFPDEERERVMSMSGAFSEGDFRSDIKEIVERRFLEDVQGRWSSKKPSAWNDEEALRTVRRWWLPTSAQSLIEDVPQNHTYMATSLVIGATK